MESWTITIKEAQSHSSAKGERGGLPNSAGTLCRHEYFCLARERIFAARTPSGKRSGAELANAFQVLQLSVKLFLLLSLYSAVPPAKPSPLCHNLLKPARDGRHAARGGRRTERGHRLFFRARPSVPSSSHSSPAFSTHGGMRRTTSPELKRLH